MATHSSILSWRISGTEEPVGYTVHGVAKSWTQLSDFHFHFCVCVCDFLGGLKERSLFPKEHERHLLQLGGHQVREARGDPGRVWESRQIHFSFQAN